MSAVRVVGIHPRAELERRAALFAALAEAFPGVRFEGRSGGARSDLDALIDLGDGTEASAAAARGIRALAAASTEADAGEAIAVTYLDSPGVDRRLRGQTLPDRHLAGRGTLAVPAGAETLARVDGEPVWARHGTLDVAALAPLELAPAEPLRARLGGSRSLALLPLLELLRALTARDGWQPPPPRAAFLLDDPNLHWPSYGYLKLPRLARHSAEHAYHLALAMVPLDAWFAHPTAARLLRERPSLSLLVHGNDHFGGELGEAPADAALSLAAQAQRRISAFERRTGIAVSRVMVPPHEKCSKAMARALVRVGFDAITMTRPYPWLAPPSGDWLAAPPRAGALAGWRPADFTPGNLPVLLRLPFSEPHWSGAELALRAYLDQPLVLYGHHDDLRGGLDVLADRTAAVNRLGRVRWSSLGDIAASNFEHRVDGELLRLRPYSRHIVSDVPKGVTHAVVETAPGLEDGELIQVSGGKTTPAGEPFSVDGSGVLKLTLATADAAALDSVPTPPRRPWPLARRLASEARDRSAPMRDLVRPRR